MERHAFIEHALKIPQTLPLIAHRHLGLGRLCAHTGKRQEAQEHLTPRDSDVPRDGNAILARKGRARNEGTRAKISEGRE
jgi:hypothetical protein